jgi:hypothetical protein
VVEGSYRIGHRAEHPLAFAELTGSLWIDLGFRQPTAAYVTLTTPPTFVAPPLVTRPTTRSGPGGGPVPHQDLRT